MDFLKKVSKVVSVSLALSLFALGKNSVSATKKKVVQQIVATSRVIVDKKVEEDEWETVKIFGEYKPGDWYYLDYPISKNRDIFKKDCVSKVGDKEVDLRDIGTFAEIRRKCDGIWDVYGIFDIYEELSDGRTIEGCHAKRIGIQIKQMKKQSDNLERFSITENGEVMYVIKYISPEDIILESFNGEELYRFAVGDGSVPQQVLNGMVVLSTCKDEIKNLIE